MRVQGPLVKRSARSSTNRRGMHPDQSRVTSNFIILSRRSVRRRNVAARAFIAVHCVGAASLLP
nr:hypothetical protein [Candidatus Burkholderia verschuerenii]